MEACSSLLFPVVHYHLLCLAHIEGEVVVLAPHCQASDILPRGCLIVGGDQAYHCCVVSKLTDGVGVVLSHTVGGSRVLSLVMSFEGNMVLNAEL